MKIVGITAFAAGILLLCALAAHSAQAQSTADITACRADAQRFCAGELRLTNFLYYRDRMVLACMRAHKAQLRPACAAVLAAHGY